MRARPTAERCAAGRVLRHTAEERGVDEARRRRLVGRLHGDPPSSTDRDELQLSQYRCYRSQLTVAARCRSATSRPARRRSAATRSAAAATRASRSSARRLLDSTAADGRGNAELQVAPAPLIANQQERASGGRDERPSRTAAGSPAALAGLANRPARRLGAERRRRLAELPILLRRRRRRRPAPRTRARARPRERERARSADGGEGSRGLLGDEGVGGIARADGGAAVGVGSAIVMPDASAAGAAAAAGRPAPPPGVADVDGIGLGDLESRGGRRAECGRRARDGGERAARAAAGAAAGEHRRHERQRAVARARGPYAQLAAERALLRRVQVPRRRRRRGRLLDDDAAAVFESAPRAATFEMANSMFARCNSPSRPSAGRLVGALDLICRPCRAASGESFRQIFVYELFVSRGWRRCPAGPGPATGPTSS